MERQEWMAATVVVSSARERRQRRGRGSEPGRRKKGRGIGAFLGGLLVHRWQAVCGGAVGQGVSTQELASWRKKTCDLQKAPWTWGFSRDLK
jgi:hypothetical protein